MLITRWRGYVFFALNVHETIERERLLLVRVLLSANSSPGCIPNTFGDQRQCGRKSSPSCNHTTVSKYWLPFSSSISNERGPGAFPLGQLLPVSADVAAVSPSIVRSACIGVFSLIGCSFRSMSKKKKKGKPPKIGHGYCIKRINPRLHGTRRSAEYSIKLYTKYSNRLSWS